MHNWRIVSLIGQNRPQQGHRLIRRISINRASKIVTFASWVIDVPICWRQPSVRYWQAWLAKTTTTCSVPHPENKLQWNVNSYCSCIVGNEGIAWIFELITELLTAPIGKNTTYRRLNKDSNVIVIANCKACKNISLVVEHAILMRYY